MDRPEPGLIKWSPNAAFDSFLHINLQHRVVQVYEPIGHAKHGRFEHRKLSQHDDFPPLTTYDWSPTIPGLLAVGTSAGIVNLLRIDDNSNAYLELNLKMARTCQAVAFSTHGMLAVGLDRVRSDQCLYVWDVNRLSSLSTTGKGFPSDIAPFTDPAYRHEPSVSVSSVKFFEDNPNTLAVGIKGQGLRIHDIRDPALVNSFQTKCNNNLAIDYADPNYFASSALDQPGIMVWDRRATSRPFASPSYLDAVDGDLPWGGALRLDNALELESGSGMSDSKNSFIRSLRYSRDHRGMLAVLSRTGQLKILTTNPELSSVDFGVVGSPELLQVWRSYEMDNEFSDPARKNDRIVSFDWVTMGSPVQRPRLLVLRASGAFEILELPSFTATYPYKLIPWQAPHRGLDGGGDHHNIIQLEPTEAVDVFGPLMAQDELSDIPLFGPNKADVGSIVWKTLRSRARVELVKYAETSDSPLPDSFTKGTTVAENLRLLRQYAKNFLKQNLRAADSAVDGVEKRTAALSISEKLPCTSRERHEKLLSLTMEAKGFPREAQIFLDHVMLLRAKEMYLFDYEKNRTIVSDDPWLRDAWAWIAGAEEATADGGMMSDPLDLSYMGVASIWLNDLGNKPSRRLSDGSVTFPDLATWEASIRAMCKKRGIPRFDGSVSTKKPHHRQLCLDICGWGRSGPSELREFEQIPASEQTTTWHTMATAHSLFRGDTKQAVQLLKSASSEHPELLFVSLALQLIGRGGAGSAAMAKEHLDFDENVASQTDPYLRAISSLIATGDWMTIARQRTLPLRERAYVAVRHLGDEQLTEWLQSEVAGAVEAGDIEGIVLTGVTEKMVDILAVYVERFRDVQTATLVMSVCAPRYVDDHRCAAWRKAYRAYLQRHKAYYQRTKFEVESTKRSKRDGRPTIKPPFRQVSLRCIYCDSQTSDEDGANGDSGGGGGGGGGIHSSSVITSIIIGPGPGAGAGIGVAPESNLLNAKMANAGVNCPTCKRQLPRCVVCLEVVGAPRSDKPESSADPETRLAARFPTFCLKCEHVMHLDHARQWFARHPECPTPECRCTCNIRANPELSYR